VLKVSVYNGDSVPSVLKHEVSLYYFDWYIAKY